MNISFSGSSGFSAAAMKALNQTGRAGAGSPPSSEQINNMFNSQDTNGDGKIDKSENDAFVAKLSNGDSTRQSKMNDLFKKSDSNGDGSVDKSEFSSAMSSMDSNMPPPSSRRRTQRGRRLSLKRPDKQHVQLAGHKR